MLEAATKRSATEQKKSKSRSVKNMIINSKQMLWQTNPWMNIVHLLQIGCKCCLLIQNPWRFYRDSMTYVKSSSRWVIGALVWTWTTCGRKVALTVHLTASMPKVLYCWFMTAFLNKTFCDFFSFNFWHWQNNLYLRSTYFSLYYEAFNCTWRLLSCHGIANVQSFKNNHSKLNIQAKTELKLLHVHGNSANFLYSWRVCDIAKKRVNRTWIEIVFTTVIIKLCQAQF